MVRRSKNDDASSSSSAESSTSIAVSEDEASSSSSSASVASDASSSSATIASDSPNSPTLDDEEDDDDEAGKEASDSEEDASSSSSSSVASSSHASSESSTTIPNDPSSQHDEDDDLLVEPRTTSIPRSSLRSSLHSSQLSNSSSGTSASETVITEVTELPSASLNAAPKTKQQQLKPMAVKANPKPAPPPSKEEDDDSSSSASESLKDASESSETVASDGHASSASGTSDSETVQTSETTPSAPTKPFPARTETASEEDNDENSSHLSGVATSDSDTVPSVEETSEHSSQSPIRRAKGVEDEEDDEPSASEEEEASEASGEEEASSSCSSAESSASIVSEASPVEEDDNATSESETVMTELENAKVASNTTTMESREKTPVSSRENSVRALDNQSFSNTRIESIPPSIEKRSSKSEKEPESTKDAPRSSDRKTLRGMLEQKPERDENGVKIPQLVPSKSFGEDVSVMTDDSAIKHLEKLDIGGKASDAVSCLNSIEESITPSEEEEDDEDQKTFESSLSQSKMDGGINMMYHDSKPSILSEESSHLPNSNSMLNLNLDGKAVEIFNVTDQVEDKSVPEMNAMEEPPSKEISLNDYINKESNEHEANRTVTTKKSGLFGRFKRGLNLSARSQKVKQQEPVPVLRALPDDKAASAQSKVTALHSMPINSQNQAHVESFKVPAVETSGQKIGFARAQSFDSSVDDRLNPHPKQSRFGFLRRPKFKKHSSFDEATTTPVESGVVSKPPEALSRSENPPEDSPLGFKLVDDAVFQTSSKLDQEIEKEDTGASLDATEPPDMKFGEPFDSTFVVSENEWNVDEPVQSMNKSTSSTIDHFPAIIAEDMDSNRPISNETVDIKSETVGGESNNDVVLHDIPDGASDDGEASENEEEEDDEESEEEHSDQDSGSESIDVASLSASDGDSDNENDSSGSVEVSESHDSDDVEESESEKEETENSDADSNESELSESVENSEDGSDTEDEGSDVLSEEENPVIVDFVDLSDMISVSSVVSKRLADTNMSKPIEDKGALDAFEADDEPVNDVSNVELFTGFNFYAAPNDLENQDDDDVADDDELTNSDEPESGEDSSDDTEEEEDSTGRDHSNDDDEPFDEQSSSHWDSDADAHQQSIVEGGDEKVIDDFMENIANAPTKTETIEMAEYASRDKDPFVFSSEQLKDAYEVEEILDNAAFNREESFTFQELNSKCDESGTNSMNPADSNDISKPSDGSGNQISREHQNLVDSAVDLMEGYRSDDYDEDIISSQHPKDEKRNGSKEQKGFNLFRLLMFARKTKKSELDESVSERQIEPVFFAQSSPESQGIIDVELANEVKAVKNAEYDVNMEHSSSLVSEDFRINEVPRRMSIGSTMSPTRLSTNNSPRKSGIGSPRKLSIPGSRKLSMSSNNSVLSNWLAKPKESSLPITNKSDCAERPYNQKKLVNSVDLEDGPVAVDHLCVNYRANTNPFDDDIEAGMIEQPKPKKSKSSQSDKVNLESKNKVFHPYCRIFAIAILAIVGLIIGVVIGTVVGRDSGDDSNEKGTSPVPPVAIAPTASPVPLLPTQSPILHQDVYETLCSVLPDCSPLLDATSAQGRAFQWLTTDGMTGVGDAQVISRYALATFYYSTNGADWVESTNWLSTLDVCEWYTSSINAPVCDNNGMFAVLDLKQNNVTGALPLEVGLLTDLTSLSIRNPIESNTTILSGRLDTMFQAIPGVSLTKLTSLSLVGNQFIGGIPTEMNALTALHTLDLSFNDLSGDIPYQLDALSNLQYVNLSNNKLTGGVPSELFNAATNMIDLNLNGNVFTSVSESVRSLTSLSRLNIGNNELVLFPTAVTSLSNLQSLDLNNNQFGGSVPSTLGSMSNLQELSLQKNDLTGEIPSAIGNLVQLSTVLNLSENRFHGTIPGSLSQLVQLKELYLHSNQLSGPVPAELIRWSTMEALRIDGNALTGTIPILLCQEWSLIRSYADCKEFNASSSGESPSTCFTFCCDAATNPSCVCNFESTEPLRCLG